ncbi:unnamed protein product [Rhizoctonia solani]|uniref:Uncharacterized protein n=1 Tax=Rhizoctonia solani TaxID=456999 RepID=A0A8H3CT66_9AGAM|nr:unnamed protein product [Rhizoctonia solani]
MFENWARKLRSLVQRCSYITQHVTHHLVLLVDSSLDFPLSYSRSPPPLRYHSTTRAHECIRCAHSHVIRPIRGYSGSWTIGSYDRLRPVLHFRLAHLFPFRFFVFRPSGSWPFATGACGPFCSYSPSEPRRSRFDSLCRLNPRSRHLSSGVCRLVSPPLCESILLHPESAILQ